MSKVRCSSIKGLNVPASGPEINLNKFSHGQPLDLDSANITTGTLTISNVQITTCNSTTLNATNVVAKDRGQITFNGDELLVPTGTDADRPSSPTLGSIRCNTTLTKMEMYTANGGGVGVAGWEVLG
jgi:hypothetical protein